MQISLKWVNKIININNINLDYLIEKLTLGGFEVDKELGVFKSNISEEKQQKVRSLIEKVKALAENDDINLLTTAIEELKSEMKDMVTSPDPLVTDASGSNPMSDLNDL